MILSCFCHTEWSLLSHNQYRSTPGAGTGSVCVRHVLWLILGVALRCNACFGTSNIVD